MVTKESKLVMSDRFLRQRDGNLRGQGNRAKFSLCFCLLCCFVAYLRIIPLWLQNADFCDAFEVHQNH